MRRIGHLAGRVLRAELDGMRALAQRRDPFRTASQQAPVVSDADGVNGIEMRAGLGVEIDEAALAVGARHHGGDAHVEVSVGLRLRVHSGVTVDEAGDEEFSRAIDDARALGCLDCAGKADFGDVAFPDYHNGIGNVVG